MKLRHFRHFEKYENYRVLIGSKFSRNNRFDSVFNRIFDYVPGTHCLTNQLTNDQPVRLAGHKWFAYKLYCHLDDVWGYTRGADGEVN